MQLFKRPHIYIAIVLVNFPYTVIPVDTSIALHCPDKQQANGCVANAAIKELFSSGHNMSRLHDTDGTK
jgi:hypothetical protein